MAFCGKCGAQINQGQKFCAKCGEPCRFSNQPAVPTAETPKSPKKNVVILCVIVSLILAIGISGVAYYFLKCSKNITQKVSTAPQQAPVTVPVPTLPVLSKDDPIAAKYCGIWEYDENGTKNYFKVVKDSSENFRFTPGTSHEGKIIWLDTWVKNGVGIYLFLSNGNLTGQFISGNFQATHGEDYTYRIKLTLISNNRLRYSVWSSIEGKTDERQAIKISDSPDRYDGIAKSRQDIIFPGQNVGKLKKEDTKKLRGWSPSFDCSKISNGPELLICSNKELSELDVQMANLYKATLRKSLYKDELIRQQRDWLKYERNTCSDVESMLEVYRDRISQLSR